MRYPSTKEVESANSVQLLKWSRFLLPPGVSAIDNVTPWYEDITEDITFESVMREETEIMTRILERQKELGGITPQISKIVGWDNV